MAVTISTHNGSSVRREHNIRNPKVVDKENHIDKSGNHETWIDIPVREAYDEIFGDAVKEYNEKQKRDERKIKSYYSKIEADAKKHTAYEMIIGVYGKDVSGDVFCSEKLGKKIMREFVENWKERNPNLKLIGAYYHADEPQAQPHVHIDYIPVASGYKNGMRLQNGLVKALEQQGFVKQKSENGEFGLEQQNAQIQWENRENKYFTELCQKYGLEVEHPKKENKHLSTPDLKLATEKLNKINQEAKSIAEKNLEDNWAKITVDKIKNKIKIGKKLTEKDEKELKDLATSIDCVKTELQEELKNYSETRIKYEKLLSNLKRVEALQKNREKVQNEREQRLVGCEQRLDERERKQNEHQKRLDKREAEIEKIANEKAMLLGGKRTAQILENIGIKQGYDVSQIMQNQSRLQQQKQKGR